MIKLERGAGMVEYAGKFFSVLGDSVSTLAGYHPPECGVFYDWQVKRWAGIRGPEDTWWGRVLEALGGHLLVNHSWSGSTVCRLPGCEVESYGCSDGRTGALGAEGRMPDVVMIFMGINDLGYNLAPEAFLEDYSRMLQKIRHNYPRAEIWCLTLPNLSGLGERAAVYNRAIRAAAEENGCRFVELFREDVPCETIDGYHPTAGGMEAIGRLVLEGLKKGAA